MYWWLAVVSAQIDTYEFGEGHAGCYITGQAAGMAASLAAQTTGEVRAVDTTTLQAKLKEIGAYLPNCS